MGVLTAQQKAAIKAVRSKFWTLPFTIEQYTTVDAEEAFDDPVQSGAVLLACFGDYTWRPEDGARGAEGGGIVTGNLLLCADNDLEPEFHAASGVRLVVEGVRYAVTGVTSYPDFGELVVTAKRVVSERIA